MKKSDNFADKHRIGPKTQKNPQIRDTNRGVYWKIIRSGCCTSRLNGSDIYG